MPMARASRSWLLRLGASGVLGAMLATTAAAAPQALPEEPAPRPVVRLASIEWPPYAGPGLPGQGELVQRVRDAYAAMGYRLEVVFVERWAEAIEAPERDDVWFHGYFPEYSSADLIRLRLLSAPIGGGPLGFVESTERPVAARRLEALEDVPVGVVRDYINGRTFDVLVEAGRIRTVVAESDLENILAVAEGRLRIAVIDPRVLEWILANVPEARAARGRVRVSALRMEDKELHVVFPRHAAGERFRDLLNEGMARVDAVRAEDAAADQP